MANGIQNTGSFGAAIGGADALKASMARRGIDSSILDQVSPAAPSGPSQVAPPPPGGSVSPGGAEQAVASQAVGLPEGTPFRSAEMELSLKALKSVVSTESKIAELSLGLR